MTCTLAVITALLGPVKPGQVVTVPASLVAQATAAQVVAAKACARKFGLRWKVAD